MGDQMAMVALTLRLHDQGALGTVTSMLVIASVVPIVVIGPLAAPLVDRVESGRLIIVATAGQALIALGLALVDNTVATATSKIVSLLVGQTLGRGSPVADAVIEP
ncbi:hypothetical protein [Streptomyces sp. KL116D]|uniref:hypothetical protein n=1 Tax=Streptomyces sp. KL116D TaxID=3045152 RepID=UPI003559324E